jgi:hypothetical protein
MHRMSAVRSLAAVSCAALALAAAIAPSGASVARGAEERPALITIKAWSATAERGGTTTRFVLSGVGDDVTFRAQDNPKHSIPTIQAVNLLATSKGREAATVRAANGKKRHAYGVRVQNAIYDPTTSVLTAEVLPDRGASDARLQPRGSTNQRLPRGPVTLAATLPAAAVTEAGAPRGVSSGSSYSVPIEINNHFYGKVFGTFLSSDSTCVRGSDFAVDVNSKGANDFTPASSFEVDTSIGCFATPAVAAYDVGGGLKPDGSGPRDCCIRLTVTQVGPRYFVSSCTDKFPIKSTCGVVFAPAVPTVRLHV